MKKKGDKVMVIIYIVGCETQVFAAFRNPKDAIEYIINDIAECEDMDDKVIKEELVAAVLRDSYALYGTWFIQELSLN